MFIRKVALYLATTVGWLIRIYKEIKIIAEDGTESINQSINQFVYCNNNYLIKYKYKYNHMKSLQGGQNEARLIMGTDPDKIMKNSKIKDCLLKSTTQLIISIH